MEFPSVCYEYGLLTLVNKEAVSAYGRAEYSKVGNPSRDKGGKKVELGRCHVAAEGERHQNLTGKAQPHANVQSNKNGLI